MSRKSLLLSIQPKFASKIFSGKKSIELRRVRPRLDEVKLVFVYVSTPVKALMGVFFIDRIIEENLSNLWQNVREKAGVTREQFDDYYEGASVGYGIYLKDVQCFPNPIALDELREIWSGFRPPQSFKYLSEIEIKLIESISSNSLPSKTLL